MGVNNSRLNANGGDVFPARIRSLLHHRIEEFRKRKSGTTLKKEGTLSKKEVLKHKHHDDNNSPIFHENETQDNNPSSNNTQPTKHLEKNLSKVVPLPVSLEQLNELRNHHQQQKEKGVEKVKSTGPRTENQHEEASARYSDGDNHNDNDYEDEDDDDDDIGSGRFVGPGSPSFKIYCVDTRKTKDKKLRENHSISVVQKSPSSISVESVPNSNSASRNSRNTKEVVEIESTPNRKETKKKKKFRGMKKNLLNIKHLHMNGMNRRNLSEHC